LRVRWHGQSLENGLTGVRHEYTIELFI